jgi:WD40 repeat protein
MSHIFISYSRKDIDFAGKIVQALAENNLDTWIDWKSIPKGEDWEQEIYRGIEEADAFLFLLSSDSVTSEMCNKEIAHAVRNAKRILPIFIANVKDEEIYGVTDKFLHKEQKEEICRRNFIKCRQDRDNFDKAIEEIQTTIQTDYEWLRYHTELQVKALKWEQKKDNSRLLQGKELREAEQQLANSGSQKDPQSTQLQRQYILASQRNEIRIRGQITIGLVVGLGIMIVLSFLAWGQRNSAINSQNTAIAEANARATAQVNAEQQANAAATARTNAEEQANIARARASELQSISLADSSNNLLSAHKTDLALALARTANAPTSQPKAYDALIDAAYLSLTSHVLQICQEWVTDLDISPDGQFIVAACSFEDKSQLFIIDTQTRNIRDQGLIYAARVFSVAFSPNGEFILAGYGNGDTVLWDLKGVQKLVLERQTGAVRTAVFSPDGSLIATGSTNGLVAFWDAITGANIHSRNIQIQNIVVTITFNQFGNLLAFGDSAGMVYELDMNTNEYIKTGQNSHAGYVLAVHYNPNGTRIISSGSDSKIKFWISGSLGLERELQGQNGWIYDSAFLPDGKTLISGSSDQSLVLWNVPEKEIILHLYGHYDEVQGIIVSPDGMWAASGGRDGSVRIWDLTPFRIAAQGQMEYWETYEINSLVVSGDGTQLYAGASDGHVRSWAADGKNLLENWDVSQAPISSLAISTDGTLLLAGSYDGQLFWWDLPSGSLSNIIPSDRGAIRSVAISPDGQTAISGSILGDITVWDVQTKEKKCTLKGHTNVINAVHFYPDNSHLISGSNDHSLLTWELSDCKQSKELPSIQSFSGHDSWVIGVDVSPDGSLIASASADQTIIIWDAITGRQTHRLRLPEPPNPDQDVFMLSVAFSPDSQLLLVGSARGSVTLWSVASGRMLRKYMPMDTYCYSIRRCRWVWSVAFSPDGRKAYAGFADGIWRAWDLIDISTPNALSNWIDKNRFIPELSDEEKKIYGIGQ